MEIPEYIEEEIENYIYEKKNNINKFTTYENILAFIKLAKMTGRITEEEAEEIKRIIDSI